MAYQINKTDGTIVSTVPDGQIDQSSTDLTLIGKNYSGFGEIYNENLIKLLENFASADTPTNPIRGQVWFDTSENRVKVYNGNEFIPVSSATIAGAQPVTLGAGDLWFNSIEKQLYFYDGTSTILLGPAYSASQGLSGLKVVSILDTLNQTRVVTYLYNNGILLGIFSKDAFTPKSAIQGFSGSIGPGFNAGTVDGFKFYATATNSEQLGGADATTYVRKDTSNIIEGQIRINTDLGLSVGSAGQGSITVSGGNVIVSNSATNRDIIFNVRKGIVQEDAFRIASDSRTVSIYDGQPASQTTIGGSLTVVGDLTVQGNYVTVDVGTLIVEDKNIVLAKQTATVPTDQNASGGGIILQGANSHIFLWADSSGQAAQGSSAAATLAGYNDSTPQLLGTAWNSSEHINIAAGKYFAINGVEVLSATSLGAGITSIPGVTSFGTLTQLNVGPASVPTIRIENNRISSINPSLPNLEISALGGSIALQGTPKITGLGTPVSANDATNKSYVDASIRSRAVVLSLVIPMDSAGNPTITNGYIAGTILPEIAPISDYDQYTFARIFCMELSNLTSTLNLDIGTPGTNVFTVAAGGSASAITSLSIPSQSLDAQLLSPVRSVRTFRLIGSAWTFIGSVTI
jgi:hypothetical protein